MKKMKYALGGLAVTMALTGCNSVNQVDKNYKTTESLTRDALKSQELNNGSLFEIKKGGIYVDKNPIDSVAFDQKSTLPKAFDAKVTVNDPSSFNASQLASFLSKTIKMKVLIQQDLVDGTFGSLGMKIGASSGGAPSAPEDASPLGSVDAGGANIIKEIFYSGTVKGLLDHVASSLNVFWKYENGNVEIYKYETKMFSLDVLAGTSKLTSNFNINDSTTADSDSSSSSESASGQQTQIDNTMSIWDEVGNSISGVLSANEKFALTPSSGKIVVMATPAHMRKVENIIKQYNSVYNKAVRLDLRMYQVELSAADKYGIDWGNLWKSASDKFNVHVNANLGSGLFTVAKNNGNAGAAIFDALSQAGKTSLLRNNSVVTLNNQTVPLSVVTSKAYVKSTKVSTTENSNSVELNTGTITTGFSMNLTPLVNDKGEVLLQYSMGSSVLDELPEFRSGDSVVQLPQKSASKFMQKVPLNNGESMVITGFQEIRGTGTDKGPLSPRLWGLGGSRDYSNNLKTIVVVVTPYIIK